MSAFTREKSELKHVDLSFNRFCKEEGQQMAEILEKDHKIYGFHFLGNDGGYIDFRGHLKFRDDKMD